MTGPPLAFCDLPASCFPVTLIAFDASGAEVWREVADEPGPVRIPPLAQTFGEVSIRVEFGDGTVDE